MFEPLTSQRVRRYGQTNLPFTFCRKWFAMQKNERYIETSSSEDIYCTEKKARSHVRRNGWIKEKTLDGNWCIEFMARI